MPRLKLTRHWTKKSSRIGNRPVRGVRTCAGWLREVDVMIVTVRKLKDTNQMYSVQMPATEVAAYIELVKTYPLYDDVDGEECEFFNVQILNDGSLEIVVKGESV